MNGIKKMRQFTMSQKLYMGEKEVRDSAGHPITIQKYQIPEYGADIREV